MNAWRSLWAAAAGLSLASAHPALAAPRHWPLDPSHAAVGFRAYVLDMWPVDGVFTQFHGVLVFDASAPERCEVDVTVDVASLALSNPALRDEVLSPGLLDAAAYPTLRYSGACDGEGIAGQLNMHGVTRPLLLAILRDGAGITAQAPLRRADWGVAGRPLLAGPTIRIRVSTTLPPP